VHVNVEAIVAPRLGHETADPASLSRGLESLLAPVRPEPQKLGACRAEIEKDLGGRLDRVDALLTQDKAEAARTLLYETDERFGGLAAPRSVELDAKREKTP
jgi:hypothetical protein